MSPTLEIFNCLTQAHTEKQVHTEDSTEGFIAALKLTLAAINHGVATFAACVAFISEEVGEFNFHKISSYLAGVWQLLSPREDANPEDNWAYMYQLKDEYEQSEHKQERVKRATGGSGDTALHLAVWSGDSALVRVLLDKGADPNVKNDLDMTPAQIAAAAGYSDVVNELQAAGVTDERLMVIERTALTELQRLANALARQRMVVVRANADDKGHLTRNVEPQEIAIASLQQNNIAITAGQVRMEVPLTELGLFTVKIQLDERIEAVLKVCVVPADSGKEDS